MENIIDNTVILNEPIYYNKIYARTDEQGVVTQIFSEAFEQPLETDICIDETNTERHGAQKYQVYDENGIANYEIVDGKLAARDKSEDIRQMNISFYPSLVDSKIRERYSVSDELAILRQRDSKPEEFAEYNTYCEECKTEVKRKLGLGG